MSKSWEWPGSRWWRLDLHTHSPASFDFGTEQERNQPDWRRWIESVRDAGLDGVAITDHNTSAAIANLKGAAEHVADAPVVFPAVEVTASCGTHLLFILDPRTGQTDVDDFLSRADVPVAQRGTREARSSKSIEQILALGDQCDGIFLGAHVNGTAGLLAHDGQQRIQELRHPNLSGVEVDPEQSLDETWLDGSRPEIGRRIPRIWCSDAHRFSDLGQRFTWVKMTSPTLEGLRLALLDGDEASLRPAKCESSGDPNAHAHLAIEEIRVHGAKYMGRPEELRLRFNPWLNAIIGGRGTGKSTLLDFIRKTLRRETEIDGTSLQESFEKRMRVPRSRRDEGLLTQETRLELVYRKDGERFLISWDQRGSVPSIQRLMGASTSSEEGDVHERFPVRIYSQKQLFELAQDPNALLQIIDESNEVRGRELTQKLKEAGERYLSSRAEARAARTRAEVLPNRRALLTDVRHKLEVLQKGGGAEALATFRLRRQQDATWRAILDGTESGISAITDAASSLDVADLDLGAASEETSHEALRSMHARLKSVVDKLRQEISASLAAAQEAIQDLQRGVDAQTWNTAVATSETEYEKIAQQLAESGISSPNEYRELVEQVAKLEREIQGLEAEERRAVDLESQAERELARYREVRSGWSERRQAFTKSVSSESLRVHVSAYSDREPEKIIASLREILRIDRFDADHDQLSKRFDPEYPWTWKILDELVVELRSLATNKDAIFPTQDARFLSALRRLSPEQLDRLALYAPDDAVEVSFLDPRRADGAWISLAQGSPGQQTAALLGFILGYGNEPILLDQPEDDLDNVLIYELVVQRLRETKASRQVIVVTHNPNIVVHGDAELVVSLRSQRGQTRIACSGGLQERAVRDEICRVMEGGRDAFEIRYRRIMPTRRTRHE